MGPTKGWHKKVGIRFKRPPGVRGGTARSKDKSQTRVRGKPTAQAQVAKASSSQLEKRDEAWGQCAENGKSKNLGKQGNREKGGDLLQENVGGETVADSTAALRNREIRLDPRRTKRLNLSNKEKHNGGRR